MRDINWSISFDITIDGEEARFSDLTESEQKKILDDLAGDYYYGTFTGDGDEKRENLWVCERCLMAIESREGNQVTLKHYVDYTNEDKFKCDWCEESGFRELYELV